MDKSEAERIIEGNLHWFRWALQLQDWETQIIYGPIAAKKGVMPEGTNFRVGGQCDTDERYRRIIIRIDPDAIDSETELLKIFRHEMFHVFHAHMTLYREQTWHQVNETGFNVMDTTFHFAIEQMVGMMERMFDDGLGLDVADMIRLAQEHRDRESKNGETNVTFPISQNRPDSQRLCKSGAD